MKEEKKECKEGKGKELIKRRMWIKDTEEERTGWKDGGEIRLKRSKRGWKAQNNENGNKKERIKLT